MKRSDVLKIIHCADIHLDSAMTTKFGRDKSVVRRQEVMSAFIDMVQYADENGVEAIIIAGDLFDSCRIRRAVAENVFNIILKYKNIDFYYLQGNHERDGFISFMRNVPDNLLLFNEEWVSYIANDKRRGNIVVSGINTDFLETKNYTVRNIEKVLDEIDMEEDDFNIVVLHGEFNMRKLSCRNINYLALGHIHDYRDGRIDARGIWCYPGALTGRGFDECGKHGFVLLDIDEDTGILTRKFVEIAGRATVKVIVDITGCKTDADIVDAVNDRLYAEKVKEDSVVRIILCGKVDINCCVDTLFIKKMFEEKYFYFEVVNDAVPEMEADMYIHDMTLKGEYIRTVMNRRDLKESDRNEIIRIGLRALAGEEI